ncbi:MAG: HAD-IC family P-type ATPase [Candidatus Pacearchaeota archaeon]
MEWHALDKEEVLKKLNSYERGISEHEASLRLKHYGKNELKEIVKISPIMIFIQQFRSVFIIILILAALFSLAIQHYIDFAVIMVIVILNSAIGFVQQYKAEKIIKEMRELLVPKVKVLRDNIMQEILSTELVPGDILLVSEGDKIMADCRVIHSNELETNEAILTGESFPQKKSSLTLKLETELANRENMLYMGTTVVKGNAKAVVISTGMNTEFGKIAKLVQRPKIEKTTLEKKLDDFSRKIALAVIVLTVITVLIGLLRGEETYHMILTGIALAVSVIPEGIPAVIAITLALAIKRMQKYNSLIRKLPAAETLGRTTVICTDKTGTITEEEMTVINLYCNEKNFEIKNNNFYLDNKKINPLKYKELIQLLRTGILCNNARIEGKKIFGDPTEKALLISAEKVGIDKKIETEREPRVVEYSFSSKRKMMSIVRKCNGKLISYVKGAPDTVLYNCSKELVNGRIIPLNEKRKLELHLIHEKMASKALRVLGFAYKILPKNFNQNNAESNLIFIGFQGMLDPPRKEVKKAIKECQEAGIKVKMITGDSLITARAIADMINLDGESIEAKELEKLSGLDFDIAVRDKTIFARITPELKLKIIQSLKHQKEIVAVTGDGINDVLALKESHIGIAMGKRGTDVARDVSDIILLDDNFSSIVKAVKEGRRVYDNMKKSIKFHLAANVGELFAVMIALIMAMPLPFLPLAILWVNLITDSLPSISLSVEKEDENIMKRKPKNPEETVLHGIFEFIIIAGILLCLSALAIFIIYYNFNLEKARTITLSTVVFFELFLVFTCRSDKNIWKIGIFSNKLLVYSVLVAFILQLIAIYSPLSVVFGFVPLTFGELILTIAFSSAGLVFFEITKAIKSRKFNHLNEV